MRKILNILILLILTLSAFGQTIKKMEEELTMFSSWEEAESGNKIDKAYTLLKKDSFNAIAIDYICNYHRNREKDSVSIFFDNLIKEHPNRVEPYLIRAFYLYKEHDFSDKVNYNKLKANYLNAALEMDTLNKKTLYFLAETYYRDFMYPREKEKYSSLFDDDDSIFSELKPEKIIKKFAFEHAADSALKYLYKLWAVDSARKDVIYFPIRQLECYLKRREQSPIKEDIMLNSYCYFPPWYFVNLSKNWECDTTVNYLFDIEHSKEFYAGWNTEQLIGLKEPCLYNRSLEENTVAYRFTWLRTFHNPISIRLEKNEKNIILYWKVGKGAGGYDPKGLKTGGKRNLTEKEWNEFMDFFNNTNFNNLPNITCMPMCDGATWTLEYKTKDNFKAYQTNIPEANKTFRECCLFLLKLTNIKIDEKKIY